MPLASEIARSQIESTDRDNLLAASLIWRGRPDIFAETAIEIGQWDRHRVHLWSKQRELLRALTSHSEVTVRSGHKTGKSFSAAVAAWWWFCTQKDAQVIMIAPSQKQLDGILWTEVKKLGSSLVFEHGARVYEQVSKGVLDPIDYRRIFGFTGKTPPENMAGFSGRILYIVDEASGLSDAVHEVISTVTNGRVLCISNPTQAFGAFYRQHTEQNNWYKLHLSSEDAAGENKMVNGRWTYEHLANTHWVDRQRANYGDGSYFYNVRVRGEFPTENTDTVISDLSVRDAWLRVKHAEQDIYIGVDVARFGDDKSCIVVRSGFKHLDTRRYSKYSNTELAAEVAKIISIYRDRDPSCRVIVNIDASNGGGVVDILNDKYINSNKISINGIMYQESAESPHYERMRDQLWFECSHWIQSAQLQKDDDMRIELVAPRYTFSPSGKRVVESKKELKKRTKRSPDSADALCLAVYHRERTDTVFEDLDGFDGVRRIF